MAVGKRSQFQNDWKLICLFAKKIMVIYNDLKYHIINEVKKIRGINYNKKIKLMMIKNITVINDD